MIKELIRKVIRFRNDRNWKQFHNAKDVAISLVLEASELMEHFQWKSEKEIEVYLKTHKFAVADELADVFYWVLLMSHDLNIDLAKALIQKIGKNKKKYPIKKSKGISKKYDKL